MHTSANENSFPIEFNKSRVSEKIYLLGPRSISSIADEVYLLLKKSTNEEKDDNLSGFSYE